MSFDNLIILDECSTAGYDLGVEVHLLQVRGLTDWVIGASAVRGTGQHPVLWAVVIGCRREL